MKYEQPQRGPLFWDDTAMFERRKKLILEMLEELDVIELEHFKLTDNLLILPAHYELHGKISLEFVFDKFPSLFKTNNKKYGITSNSDESRVGTGKETFTFTKDEIREMSYTTYHDYITQIILLFLVDYFDRKNVLKKEKGQE